MTGSGALKVDPITLTRAVQHLLNAPSATLATWHVQPIVYPRVSPSSRGLYRLTGTAQNGAATRAWSLVLKVLVAPAAPQADDPAAAFFWQREALAYQSGLLPNTPGGLIAPSCYGVTQPIAGSRWLWLEHISADDDSRWSLPRYGLAARHLGLFGGTYLATAALPGEVWLSRKLIRAWIADAAPLIELISRPDARRDPLLQRTLPDATVAQVLRLWADRERLFNVLERLPQTLCHHDLWRKNLLSRLSPGGAEETVALDWELVGLGAAGEDVGNLLGVSLLNFDVESTQAEALAETMLAHYLAGLQQAGWRGDAQAIRYAFMITAALRCVFSTACWPAAILRDEQRYVPETEQRWQRPIQQIFEQWAAVTEFLLRCADHARVLADGLERHDR